MNSWYVLSLGDGVISGGLSAEIEERFMPLFTAAGKPLEMAVYTRPESENRLYCEVIAYFSPASADVAKACGAHPCAKPERLGLRLLAGDEQSWSILFPESETA
jgi:hypothetical protein